MKNSPTLELAIQLWLASAGITGFPAWVLTIIALSVVGNMLDRGIILIDIRHDKIKEAMKDKRWRDKATKIYGKAIARVYTEKEKDEIRKTYLDTLGDYASLADRLRELPYT